MEQGNKNLILVDARMTIFRKRSCLKAFKSIEDVEEALSLVEFDEQALKQILVEQNCTFLLVFPSKNELKSIFYRRIQEENPLFSTIGCIQMKDLEAEVNRLIEKGQFDSLTIVSHDLRKFKPNTEISAGKMQVYRILFSGFAQDYKKMRLTEVECYSEEKLVDYHVNSLYQVAAAVSFLKYQENKSKDQTCEAVINVGFYTDYGKLSQLNTYGVTLASYPFRFTPLDFRLQYETIPYTNGCPIRVLIHKFQDFYKNKLPERQAMIREQEKNLNEFIKKFSKTVAIIDDNLEGHCVQSRIQFDKQVQFMLQQEDTKEILMKYPHISVTTPRILPFDPQTDDAQLFLSNAEKILRFPILIKTDEACASNESHLMAIVLNMQSLRNFIFTSFMRSSFILLQHIFELFLLNQSKLSVIVQELINHDSRINKVYVMGNNTEIQVRVSIPNITVEEYQGNEQAIWAFNSQKGFKEQLPIHVLDQLEDPITTLNQQLIPQLSQKIRKYFNINVFGYDIVQRTRTQEYYIIDINYFPGFKKITNIPNKFHQLFRDQINAIGHNKD